MKKQTILILSGIILIVALYFFGKTVTDKPAVIQPSVPEVQNFDIQDFISKQKVNLSPNQQNYLNSLEEKASQTGDSQQKSMAFTTIANFWKDSVQQFEAYVYYISMSSKLDNSEKSLTFAAQLILDNLRGEQDQAKLNWESNEAISLFEKAIELNPSNDDLKIGLASCFIYGKGRSGDPQQTMKGIQELLGVVRRDSTNMKAQLVLGIGGFVSGQYDKALVRLTKVVTNQPDNLEAIAFLADTYAAMGNKEDAIKWYNISKRLINNPEYSKEVDKRINQLQQK